MTFSHFRVQKRFLKLILVIQMYSSKNTNPFYEDDDDEFPAAKVNNAHNNRKQQILDEISSSEQRQLASSQRALASIYDSERIGVAAGEELVRQGEQLDNVERKTDEINKNLTISQKHLNSIKSVFGGIKTWWSGKGTNGTSNDTPPEKPNQLKENLEKNYQSTNHPAMRFRSDDNGGFYLDDPDLDSKFLSTAQRNTSQSQMKSGPMFKPVTKSDQERQLDENLAMMSQGMSKLKDLSLNLGDEIIRQNDQLDRINIKAAQTDDNLTDKNLQMRRILKK